MGGEGHRHGHTFESNRDSLAPGKESPMPIRRRPVLRAAAVGGIGYPSYSAGKAAAPVPARQTERIKALSELKRLLDLGAVTQAEFDQAKKALLEGLA